jgi:hypothetical protein
MTKNRSAKEATRARMAATAEPYSVAVRALSMHSDAPLTPTEAFLKAFGKKDFQDPHPYGTLQAWTVPIYQLFTAAWSGDTAPLAALGSAYRSLEEEGHYFCHHRYALRELAKAFGFEDYFEMDTSFSVKIPTLDAPNYYSDALIPLKMALPYRSFSTFDEDTFDAAYDKHIAFFSKSCVERVFQERGAIALRKRHVLGAVAEDLAVTLTTAHDSNGYSSQGIRSLILLWELLPQTKRLAILGRFTEAIRTRPPLAVLDTEDILYNAYVETPPAVRQELTPGQRVRFADDRTWWTVRGASENFAVLTRSARVAGESKLLYTIISWKANRRGAHNSYGAPVVTDADVANVLDALEAPRNELALGRNQLRLRIATVQ